MTRRALAAAVLAFTLMPGAAQAFDAHGSVQQVYVTGLRAKAKASLLHRGHRVATRRADALGGLLFRGVRPGGGYRVRSGSGTPRALTVLPNRSAPPKTSVYRQPIPSSGYGYLTTRDGTK